MNDQSKQAGLSSESDNLSMDNQSEIEGPSSQSDILSMDNQSEREGQSSQSDILSMDNHSKREGPSSQSDNLSMKNQSEQAEPSNQSDNLSMNDQSEQARPSSKSDNLDIDNQNFTACFLPDQDCISRIIKWIDLAKQSIIVQAYSFSSPEIADALIKAKDKGIRVNLFIDKDADRKKGNLIQELRDSKIEIEVDEHEGLAHNKVMIIDDEYVITGSYNWTSCVSGMAHSQTTSQHNKNSEVILFIRDECVTWQYKGNYYLHINKKIKLSDLEENRRYLFGMQYINAGCCGVSIFNSPFEENENFVVDIKLCFPGYNNQDCIKLITDYIKDAKESIFIQACSLTHIDIYNELINAYRRGIDIKLLVDINIIEGKEEKVRDLFKKGIKIKYDIICVRGMAHSKTIIIDDDLVLTGSLNFTRSAQERNLENLVCLRNTRVNAMFKRNFYKRWDKGKEIEEGKEIEDDQCVIF